MNLNKPLTLTRRKRVPCMPGENIVDEPIDDPLLNFKVNTYYVAIDKVLIQIQERFSDISTGLCKDLSLFSRRRLKEVADDHTKLPLDAFDVFTTVYKQFINKNDLIREYFQFSKCCYNFETKIYLPFKLHDNGIDRFLDNDSDAEKTDESSSCDYLELETKNGELLINGNSMATIKS